MRRLLLVIVVAVALLAAQPAAAQGACDTTGGANALESAALGLGAREWCQMAPNVTGATLTQLLTTCGGATFIQHYGESMSYDPGTQTIFYFGTPHGGGHHAISYSVSTNTWSASPSPSSTLCGSGTCVDGPPNNGSIPTCSSCNAEHGYDGNTADGAGNFYFVDFNSGNIHRRSSGGTWTLNWQHCPQSGGFSASTAALVYWPDAGATGSLIMICDFNEMNDLYRFDLSTATWTNLASNQWSPTYHNQAQYHPGAQQVWVTAGNGATSHARLSWSGSAVTVTALGAAPSDRLGMTTSRCAADPASADTFICWDLGEDVTGTGVTGWYAYDLSANTWTSFSSLGVSSMPPLDAQDSDVGGTATSVAVIPEYGVQVWLATAADGGSSGMYVYKHTVATPACSDAADNDGDGSTDFPTDTGCGDANDATETRTDIECDDGIDNDSDTLTDFPDDPNCSDILDNTEGAIAACNDGADNDGDGSTDFPADPGCTGTGDTSELGTAACDDGVDNDADTFTDWRASGGDPGCTGLTDSAETNAAVDCDDGVDDDGDGYADSGRDAGCSSPTDASELSGASVPTADAVITLKESSAVNITNWPTTAVIPLPSGVQATTNLRIWDPTAGDNVPATFLPIEREWNGDNEIRHVAVHFEAQLAGSGGGVQTRAYHFHDEGGAEGYGPKAVAVAVDNTPNPGQIQVTTGPLRFVVSKSQFNLFDTVWYDADGDGAYESSGGSVKADERIIVSGAGGGVVDHCDDPSTGSCLTAETDQTSQTTVQPDLVSIEENNGQRVVLRLEAYTRYDPSGGDTQINDMTAGYVVRIYAYAGKSQVKVDWQIINAATDDWGNQLKSGRWADPFYFDSAVINLQPVLGTTTVKTSRVVNPNVDATDSVDTRTLNAGGTSGVELAYTSHDLYFVRQAAGAAFSPAVTCDDSDTDSSDTDNDCDTASFMDLSDGTWGVQTVMRNMWRMWPSGIEVNSTGRLQVQLFPDWSSQWFNGLLNTTTGGPNPGVYWLDDMQAVYKEVLFNFHGATPSDAALIATARSFDRYPVPTLPLTWHQGKTTLDLGGLLPFTTQVGSDDPTEDYLYRPNSSSGAATMLAESGWYQVGWGRYADYQPYRLSDGSEGGDGPTDAQYFLATQSPDTFWEAQRWTLADMNARPQWMGKDYTYADDYAAMQLSPQNVTVNLPDDHWRGSGTNQATYPLAGGRYAEARDQEHFWFWHFANYFYDYNLWAKDFLTWLGQEERHRTLALDGYNFAPRSIGGGLTAAWLSYRVNNDAALLNSIADTYIPSELTVEPLCGLLTSITTDPGAQDFQLGFFGRALLSIAREFKSAGDYARWARTFLLLSAQMEWHLYYGNYSGAGDNCTIGSGLSSGVWTVLDPVASYYWTTGKQRFMDDLLAYSNLPSPPAPGNGPYNGDWTACETWDGCWSGRTYDYVDSATRADATPPAPPSGVSFNTSNQLLQWTKPASDQPAYYLIVWTNTGKTIYECTTNCLSDPSATNTTNFINWWAAKAHGVSFASACSGSVCSITIPGAAGATSAALFAFDAADNMSTISTTTSECTGQPNGTPCTSDGIACTDDVCAGGVCTHPNNTSPCDDGQYCNGADTCGGGGCNTHAGNPCPGPDGDTNCAESCNESNDTCTLADPDGVACGSQTSTTCDAPNTCATGTCANNYAAVTTPCDNGVFCHNGTTRQADDACDGAGTCAAGGAGASCADADICTDDACTEATDTCDNISDPTNDPSCVSQCRAVGIIGRGIAVKP